MARCRWIADASVPGGRYHVPECWGTVHDPHGICNCAGSKRDTEDRIDGLERIVNALAKQVATLATQPQSNGE